MKEYGKKFISDVITCYECKYVSKVAATTFQTFEELTKHLVEAHDYALLPCGKPYKKRKCKCGATALYSVGHVGYCKEHYQYAQLQLRRTQGKLREEFFSSQNEKNERVDRSLKKKDRLRNLSR